MIRGLRFLKWASRPDRRNKEPGKKSLGLAARHRTLACEPLEDRCLLSVTSPQIDLFNASPALFVQNQGQVADQSSSDGFECLGANLYTIANTGAKEADAISPTTMPASTSAMVSAANGNGVAFRTPLQFLTGGGVPASNLIADFNGDGKADIAAVNRGWYSTGSVGVLLGNGDGTFAPVKTFYSGGSDAWSAAAGDFNGDGKADIAVANFGSGTVGILLGNGDGTFAPVKTLSSGGPNVWSVTIGDFNGDGKVDLATANFDYAGGFSGESTVGVHLGNGDGTFAPVETFNSGGFGAWSVVSADFNDDGKTDIAVANRYSNTVGVLLGDGDGGFSTVTTFYGGDAYSLAIGDFNGDGKADIATATGTGYSPSGAVGVFLGNGDGSFTTVGTFSSGAWGATSVAVADFNGDGKADIAIGNESYDYPGDGDVGGAVGVLLGNGDGTFALAKTFLIGGDWGGEADRSVAIGDFNGDGQADISYTCENSSYLSSGSLGVLLNITSPPFEVLAKGVAYEDWTAGAEVTYVGYGGLKYTLNYEVDWVLNDTTTGLYALGLTSSLYGACLVLRGTDSLADWVVVDTDPRGVGYSQFESALHSSITSHSLNKTEKIFDWLTDYSRADIVGHSLGAALTQWIAAAYTAAGGLLDQVVTFNGTGISASEAAKFAAANVTSVTHYIVNGDIVSMAGQAFIGAGSSNCITHMATFSDPNPVHHHSLPLTFSEYRVYHAESNTYEIRKRPVPISWQTISITDLNSPFFSYTDRYYNLYLLWLEAALCSTSATMKYAAVPAELKFRGTTEAKRHDIGEALKAVPVFHWSTDANGNYVLALEENTGLGKWMSLTVDPDFTLTVVNGSSPSLRVDGGLSLDLGDAVNISLPSWLGGSIAADHLLSLANMDDSGVIDASHLAVDGELSILGGLITIDGSAQINWKDGACAVSGQIDVGNGFIDTTGAIRIGSDLDFALKGTATVAIPKGWPLGGTTFANGSFAVVFTNDGNMSNDYVAVWKSVSGVPVGLRIWLDGHWQLLGAKEIASISGGSAQIAQYMMRSAAAATSAITPQSKSYLIEPGTDWAMFFVDWQDASSTATLTLRTPSGQVLTESDASVTVLSELSNDCRKAVKINSPEAGTWTATLTDAADFGTVDFSAYVNDTVPTVSVTSLSGGIERQPVIIDLAAYDSDSVATITLFYDTDNTGYDGVMIANGILEADGTIQYTWNTAGVAAGDYYVYAMIQDDNNPPVFNYSGSAVAITDDASPPTVTLTAPALTDSNAPLVSSTASDATAGVPDGTLVFLDVDINGDGTFESDELALATTTLTGGTATFTASSYVSLIADGTYAVRARLSDAAGNEGISAIATITIDTTPPTVTLDAPEYASNSTLTGTVTAVDTGSGVADGTTVYLDVDLNHNGSFTDAGEMGFATATLTGGTAIFSSPLPVGYYQFRARVSDAAGNEGTSSAAWISLGASLPELTVHALPFANSSTPTVIVTATGGDPGAADGTLVFLDVDLNHDGEFAGPGEVGNAIATLTGGTATATLSLPVGEDGTYQIRARASDMAGNEVTSDEFGQPISTVTVDTIAPTATIEPASFMTSPTSNSTIYFTVTFSEPLSDFNAASITLGGTAGATTATLLAGGGDTCIVEVSGMTRSGDVTASIELGKLHDRAGNANTTSTSATVVYDTTLPNTSVGVSGVVWNDRNGDGIQSTGEPGIGGAVVQVYLATHETAGNADDILLRTAVTDAQGRYSFSNLPGGASYYEIYRAPVGYTFTIQNAGDNISADSDPDATGVTPLFAVPAGQTDATRDAGLVGTAPGFGFAFSLPNATPNFTTADALGNVYVVGSFAGTIDFDPGPGTFNLASTSNGMFAAKYSSAGALIWAKSIAPTNDVGAGAIARGIALGSDGSIYTTGTLAGTVDFDPGAGISNLVSFSNDVFVWKLDAEGNFIWAKSTSSIFANGSQGWAYPIGIAAGSDGSLYVGGNFSGTVDFDPGLSTLDLTSAGFGSVFDLKLDSSGNFDWARSASAAGNSNPEQSFVYAYGITVANDGGVYTTGDFTGTVEFDPTDSASYLVSSSDDAFVWKLDSNGSFVWAKSTTSDSTSGSHNAAVPNGIVVGTDGSLYVAGTFSGTVDFDPGPDAFNLTSGSIASYAHGSIFILKLDATGDFVWAKGINGINTQYDTGIYGIAVGANGHVYTTGEFDGTVDFDPGSGTFNLAGTGHAAFVLNLNATGDFAWVKTFSGAEDATGQSSNDCYAGAIAVGLDGNLYTSGSFSGMVDFDPGPNTFNLTSGVYDNGSFVLKLDNTPPIVTVDRLTTSSHSPALSGTVDDPSAVIQVTVDGSSYGATNNGNGTWTLPENTINPSLLPGLHEVAVTATDLAGNVGTDLTTNELRILTTIQGRHIFYNRSAFDGNNAAANAADDNAIAIDKSALLPGQVATFTNYTSYSRGINGIMVDFDHLPNAVTATDFEFKMGNTLTPDSWTTVPAPQSVAIRQVNGVSRVTIIWADNAIEKQWLQVTVKATTNTGLAQNDVFYFGNAVGESGDSPLNAYVDSTDQVGARDNPHGRTNLATVMDVYDYNRDKYVDSTDRIIARDNATSRTNALKLITAPSVVTTDDVAATDEHTAVSVAVLSNDRDTKGGALSVFHVNATSSLGASLTINPDKTIRYDPSASATLQALLTGQSLWDTFTYTIKDSKGLLDTATVKVLVSGLDEPSGVKGVQIAASGIGSVVSALPSATANAKAHTFGRAAACDTVFKSWSFDNSFGCLSWLDDFDLLGYLSQKSKKGSSSFDHAVDTVRAHSASRRNWAV